MSQWVESHIEFDFSSAINAVKHDDYRGRPNPSWPGVDFRIEEDAFQIWLEVKNWNPRYIAPKYRGEATALFSAR